MRVRSLSIVFAVSLAGCGGGGGGGASESASLPGVYVNATSGDDTLGDGSADYPYRTIRRGLQGAGYGDTVRVGPGTYDTSIGERFPIIPGFGVTIQGTEIHTTEGPVRLTHVVGGGTWSGDPEQRLNATFLPNTDDRLVGLRITNPVPAALNGAKPQAVLLVFSGATVESCSLEDSDRGVRFFDGVSGSVVKGCAMVRNGIGVFVDSAGADNRVEGSIVKDNAVAVMCFSMGVDFGGGTAGSSGHNAFLASATNDFVHFTGTAGVIEARDCFWDHVPPTFTYGSPPNDSADVWIYALGSVDTTGAGPYVPPGTATIPPGGGTAAP